MALGDLSSLLGLQQASLLNQLGAQQQFSTGFVQTATVTTGSVDSTLAANIIFGGTEICPIGGHQPSEVLMELRGRVQAWLAPIDERLRKYA